VKPRTGELRETLERLLPFLTIVAVITAGWFWLLQPRLNAHLRARTDTVALEERVRTLQQLSKRTPPPPVDLDRTQREFEARLSAEDKVAEVAAALARAVLASAPAGQLRSFVIETGEATSSPSRAAAQGHAGPGDGAMDGDPRLALFPYAVRYTPLRVSFESTFEAAAATLWRLRDLPTMVDVRSAALTRGLPLMRTEVLVRVLQRGDAMDVAGPAVPGAGPAETNPNAPRLAPPSTEPGGQR
jgi:hypothetical protein